MSKPVDWDKFKLPPVPEEIVPGKAAVPAQEPIPNLPPAAAAKQEEVGRKEASDAGRPQPKPAVKPAIPKKQKQVFTGGGGDFQLERLDGTPVDVDYPAVPALREDPTRPTTGFSQSPATADVMTPGQREAVKPVKPTAYGSPALAEREAARTDAEEALKKKAPQVSPAVAERASREPAPRQESPATLRMKEEKYYPSPAQITGFAVREAGEKLTGKDLDIAGLMHKLEAEAAALQQKNAASQVTSSSVRWLLGADDTTALAAAQKKAVDDAVQKHAQMFGTNRRALEMEAASRGIPLASMIEAYEEPQNQGQVKPATEVMSEVEKRGVDLEARNRINNVDINWSSFSPQIWGSESTTGVLGTAELQHDAEVVKPGERGYETALQVWNAVEEDGYNVGYITKLANERGGAAKWVQQRVADLTKGVDSSQPDYDAKKMRAWNRAVAEIAAFKTIGLWASPIFMNDLIAPDYSKSLSDRLWDAVQGQREVVGYGPTSDQTKPRIITRAKSTPATFLDAIDIPQQATVGFIEEVAEKGWDQADFAEGAVRGIEDKRDFMQAALQSDWAKPTQVYDAFGQLKLDAEGQPVMEGTWKPVVAGGVGFVASVLFPDLTLYAGKVASVGGDAYKGLRDARRLNEATNMLEGVIAARAAGATALRDAEKARADFKAAQLRGATRAELDRLGAAESEARQVSKAIFDSAAEQEANLRAKYKMLADDVDRMDAQAVLDLARDNPDVFNRSLARASSLSDELVTLHPSLRRMETKGEEVSDIRAKKPTEVSFEDYDRLFNTGRIVSTIHTVLDDSTSTEVVTKVLRTTAANDLSAIRRVVGDDDIAKQLVDDIETTLPNAVADPKAWANSILDRRNDLPAINPPEGASEAAVAAAKEKRSKLVRAVVSIYSKAKAAAKEGQTDIRGRAIEAALTNNESRIVAASIMKQRLDSMRQSRKSRLKFSDPTLDMALEKADYEPNLTTGGVTFKKQLVAAGLPEKQAQIAAIITDARARVASWKRGISTDEWYASRIEGVVKGEAAGFTADALYQEKLAENVDVSRLAVPEGFFSPLQRAIAKVIGDNNGKPVKSGYLLQQVKKQSGVKADELQWSGLDDFLAGKERVSLEEVTEWLAKREPVVEVKGVGLGADTPPAVRAAAEKSADLHAQLSAVTNSAESWLVDKTGIFTSQDMPLAAVGVQLGLDKRPGPVSRYSSPRQLSSGDIARVKTNRSYPEFAKQYKSYTELSDGYAQSMRDLAEVKKQHGVSDDVESTVYNKYVAPGPSANYREIRAVQPAVPNAGGGQTMHFEPNAIYHLRTTDRVTEDGKKVLFVEEVQSDWHQAGSKDGYFDKLGYDKRRDALKQKRAQNVAAREAYLAKPANAYAQGEFDRLMKEAYDIRREEDTLRAERKKVDRLPQAGAHAETWRELALKQALIIAAREGYDGVAMTRGPIIARVAGGSGVGGELPGQLAFYEEILPNTAASLAKKNGSRLETTRLNVGAVVDDEKVKELRSVYARLKQLEPEDLDTPEGLRDRVLKENTPEEDAEIAALKQRADELKGGSLYGGVQDWTHPGGKPPTAWSVNEGGVSNVPFIPVTPAMKAKVESEGLPLFSRDTVNTPAFKKWFGDSVVTEANTRRPLVVYHGTSSKFDSIKPSLTGAYGPGIYFTSNADEAVVFAKAKSGSEHVYPAYLNMVNPLLGYHEPETALLQDIAALVSARHASGELTSAEFNDAMAWLSDPNELRAYIERNDGASWLDLFKYTTIMPDVNAAARKNGYDGIIVYDSLKHGGDEYVVFSPEQVMLAQNMHELNLSKNSRFNAWFKSSKAVLPNGAPMPLFHGTTKSFDAFAPSSKGTFGSGIYMTPDKSKAAAYGRPITLFASVQRPFVFDGTDTSQAGIAKTLQKHGFNAAVSQEIAKAAYSKGVAGDLFRDMLKSEGYDGIFVYKHGDTGGSPVEIVVFSPEQVKSVHNSGAFNPQDPRLLYSKDGASFDDAYRGKRTYTPEFESDRGWLRGGMFKLEEAKTAREAAQVVAKYADNPAYRHIAGKLSEVIEHDETFKFSSAANRDAAGTRSPAVNTASGYTPGEVTVYRGYTRDYSGAVTDAADYGYATAHTVIHELVHSATAQQLHRFYNKGQKAVELSDEAKEACYDLQSLHEYVVAQAKSSPALAGVKFNEYGLKNVFEFTSEALSNPSFQNLLKRIPANREQPGRSLWTAFVEKLRIILGLDTQDASAFDQVIDATARLIDTSPETHATLRHFDRSAEGRRQSAHLRSFAEDNLYSSVKELDQRNAEVSSLIDGIEEVNKKFEAMQQPLDNYLAYFDDLRDSDSPALEAYHQLTNSYYLTPEQRAKEVENYRKRIASEQETIDRRALYGWNDKQVAGIKERIAEHEAYIERVSTPPDVVALDSARNAVISAAEAVGLAPAETMVVLSRYENWVRREGSPEYIAEFSALRRKNDELSKKLKDAKRYRDEAQYHVDRDQKEYDKLSSDSVVFDDVLYSNDASTAARLLEANQRAASLKAEVDDLTARLAASKKRSETLKAALASTKSSRISPDSLRSATIRLKAEMEAVKGDVEAITEQLKAKKAAHAEASKAATLAKKDDAAAEKVVVKADKKGESVPVTQARARLTAARKDYNAAARQLSEAKIALADAVSSKAKPAEVKALKSRVEAAALLEKQKGDDVEKANALLTKTMSGTAAPVTTPAPAKAATPSPTEPASAPLPAAHGTPMGGVDPAVAVDASKVAEAPPAAIVEEVSDAERAAETLDTSTPSTEDIAKAADVGPVPTAPVDASRVEPVAGVVEGPSLPRGAVTFADDGRAIIHAFEGANVETFLHEVGHIMRRDLDADEAEAVVDWLRAQTGDNSLDIVDGKLIADDATTAEELFAEGFTAYLRTGVSPTANLQRAFSYLHSWLREIYKTVRGFFPQSVTPETAKMFDGLLSIDKSDEAIKKAMRMGIDPKATPNIIKRAYRELIGPALPQAPKTMDELAKAAQASGLDVTAEKLAAIMERDGKIDFPHPVAGKASYTEDDLRRFQASIERARTKAREEARLKMALSSPNEAVTEATPTEALWNRVSGDTNGSKLARAATAAFIGLDADLDLRAIPAHLRAFIKMGARNVEAAYSDGVKLLTERDPEKFRRWLAGTPTKLHNGRNAISSGYDMAGNVRMNARLAMASFSDKAREGAHRAAFSTTSDAVGTLTEESRELVSKGVVEMLYATNSDFLKQLGEVLDIPGRNAGIGVVVNPRPQEVRLTGALHRFAHMDSDTLPAVDDLLDIVEDIYGPDKAARVGLLIAGHGAGHKVIQKWYNLGITVSPKEAMVFQSWLHAEKMSPEDFKLAQRTAEKFGLDPRFVPVAGQFGTIHVPEAARKRLAAAMAKPTQESLNWLSSPNDIGRGIYKDTVKPGQAAYDLIGFFTRGLKAGMTRGNMFVSSWFNFANTIDHMNQVGGVAGFGAALATSQRLLAQDLLIFMPFLSRAADVGRRFGVLKPDAIEKMRRVLSEGGDRMSVLIQKVALANTCSVNTNKVLDGLDETVNLGGRWYNYKDIRQAYIDFGVAGSYAGELENALRKNLQPPTSLAEKLGDRVADYMEYVEEMHEGLAERERVGAMLTFIEMGASPEDAARLAVAALFDYGSSVAAAERSAFLAIFFPFWAFQKNANAFTINNLLTPWGAYRIGAIRRMWEGSTEALSEIFYGTVADPYGIDNRALSDTGRANYYALRAELEAMYGGSEHVPDDVKLALRHMFGQLPAYMMTDGKISQLSEKLSAAVEASTQASPGLNPLTGRPAMLDVAEAYLPKPDRATSASYNRDRPAITMTYAKTEAMKRYLSLAPDDHPFTELYLPENTIVSGLRHCLNLAAATVLLPQKLYAWGAGKVGEGGQDPEWFGINETRVAGPLTQVLDPDRSLLLPEISADLLGGAEAVPYRIHPFLGRIMEDSGLPLMAVDGKIDPFGLGTDASPEAVKENEALMANPTWTGRRKDDKNVAIISEKRYYAPGGLWSVAIKRTPGFHDLNRILLSTDQTTLEGAGGLRGDLLTTASTILGIPVSENIGDKSAAREEPRKPDENLNPNK